MFLNFSNSSCFSRKKIPLYLITLNETFQFFFRIEDSTEFLFFFIMVSSTSTTTCLTRIFDVKHFILPIESSATFPMLDQEKSHHSLKQLEIRVGHVVVLVELIFTEFFFEIPLSIMFEKNIEIFLKIEFLEKQAEL